MNQYVSNSIEDLPAIATRILERYASSKIFALYGDMGVGKTTFMQSLCTQLQITENITSPTFALVNEYKSTTGIIVYHFDLYRLNSIHELLQIGFDDYIYSGNYCFIEWPEIAEPLLPETVIKINISENEHNQRIFTL